MQLNSNSFSHGRAQPRRSARDVTPVRRGISLRRGVWLAVAVLLLVAVASNMPSWFVEKPEPVQSSFVRKPAERAHPDLKTRIKALFGPAPGQRLAG